MVSIMLLVPVSNLAISNTPMGPFQMIVWEPRITSLLSLMLSGPQSSPMKPAGMPLAAVAVVISPSSPNLLEMTKSTGSVMVTPLALASAMICDRGTG